MKAIFGRWSRSAWAAGRVEVAVSLQQRRTPALDVELNEAFLEALGGALERARERGYISGSMTPGDLLRFPAGALDSRT